MQLAQLWARLVPTQRILLIAAVVGVIGAVVALQRWNHERGFEPVFSGMSPEDAGAVTAKLRESNVEYRLSEGGGTILVKADKVAEVRLQLAAAGLPQTGRLGFELFDQANFGASEFTEQVNYHRAIEGELERSVKSLREVESARVHISMSKESLYLESRQPAKASVLVKLRPGALLSPQNVAAITQLAASAVPGLQANQVTVLDTAGNLLSKPRAVGFPEAGQVSEGVLEYRKALERDIQAKVAQTLEPLLGAEHFRTGVSADLDLTNGDLSEETFDPNKSVMVTSQTSQDMPAPGAGGNVPGTATNLPRATASQANAAASVTNYGRKTESTSFQTSRVIRHIKLGQGALRKLSLSILVDHSLRYDKGKPIVEAPTPEKLKVVRDLVAGAVGIDMERGDQLVVEAFPFESTLAAQPLDTGDPAAPGNSTGGPSSLPPWLQKLMDNKILLAGVGGGLLLLLLGGGFLLMRRKNAKKGTVDPNRELKSPTSGAEKQLEARLAEQIAEQQRQEAEAMLALKLPAASTKKADILIKHISAEVKKNPAAMAQVVRSWLNGEYQR